MQLPEDLAILCDRAVRTSRCIDTRLGLDLALQAHRRARAEGDPKGVLMALNAVAICQAGNGAHIYALSTTIDAYRMALSLGERGGAAHALLTLTGAAHDLFEVPGEESIRMLRRCLDEAVALGDVSLEVRTRNAIGLYYDRHGRFAEGFAEFDRALALVSGSDGTTPPALIVGNVAYLAVRELAAGAEAKRPALAAEAHRLLDQALAMALAERTTGQELRAHLNRGRLHHELGEYQQALEDFARALEIASRLRNASRVADINLGIGDTLVSMGRQAKAAVAYEAAYAVASAIRPAHQLHVICTRMADALDHAGDRGAAKRARDSAAMELATYQRELAHARREFDLILVSSPP